MRTRVFTVFFDDGLLCQRFRAVCVSRRWCGRNSGIYDAINAPNASAWNYTAIMYQMASANQLIRAMRLLRIPSEKPRNFSYGLNKTWNSGLFANISAQRRSSRRRRKAEGQISGSCRRKRFLRHQYGSGVGIQAFGAQLLECGTPSYPRLSQ